MFIKRDKDEEDKVQETMCPEAIDLFGGRNKRIGRPFAAAWRATLTL